MEAEDKEEKSIEKTVQDGLESPTMDLTIDYAELALDSFLDNGIIKEIPIVKSVVGVIRGGMKIREIHFAKKLLTFLKEFHSAKLEESIRVEFQKKFNSDSKYRNSVVCKLKDSFGKKMLTMVTFFFAKINLCVEIK